MNDVAADGIAAPLPDRLVLAPRPVELRRKTRPVLPAPVPACAAGRGAGRRLRRRPPIWRLPRRRPTESASPTELAVDAAIAEALGLDAEMGRRRPVATEDWPMPVQCRPGAIAGRAGGPAAEPAPEGAITALAPAQGRGLGSRDAAARESRVAAQDLPA